MILREENRRVLEARAPALLSTIAVAEVPASFQLGTTAAGAPTLAIGGVPLHHPRDPHGDGVRWARGAAERLAAAGAVRAVVVGLGLGYHVEALAERFAGTIVVVEPDPAVWRVALASRDLAGLLERVQIELEPDPSEDAATGAQRTRVLGYAPSLLLPGDAYRRALTAWRGSAARLGVRLKILVVSPMYGGSWPIAGYTARALAALGHETVFLDLAAFHDGYRALERFGTRRARRGALERSYADVLGAGVVGAVEAHEPDIVLALAQAPLTPAALQEIGRLGAVRVMWFVEDFRVLTYWREVAGHYDYFFTIQDGECHDALRGVSGAHLDYLPCAFDPDVHRPLSLTAEEQEEYGGDVAFVGAGYRNRRLAFRRFLDLDFRIWGSDWGGAGDLARVIQRDGDRMSTEESVRVFNAAKVNLNLHSSTYHDEMDPRGDFVNPRTFELAGCGAFQVTDGRALLPPLFDGGELAIASSISEMRALTEHYLAHPEERIPMAGRARRRALAEHTYRQRLQRLLATVVGREQDRFLGRARTTTVGDVLRQRSEGAFGEFLAQFPPALPFTLDGLVASIPDREGALSEPEAIFLFLHQFDELYLREIRA